MIGPAISLDICPRCGCFSMAQEYDITDFCLVCGYFADDTCPCELPHFNCSYRPHIPPNPEGLDLNDLKATEAWLIQREAEGYEFSHFVVVDIEKKVHWLRGDPEKWIVRIQM